VLIQESKVGTCDVRPGRRPTGPALRQYIAGYLRRAGLDHGERPPIVTARTADTSGEEGARS
jgi:formate dehydrogenase major subunit